MFNFGVTFYPDQWPKEYWNKAFGEISDAGFSLVRFGEMAWDWVQPSENKFSFKEMDEALDVAAKNGVKVLLGIPTSQIPPWMIKKHNDLRPVDNEGVKYPEYGPRPNVCKDSSIYMNYAEKLIKTMVKRYKKHPALWMWQIDNEPVIAPLDSTTQKDFCHCKYTEHAFRKWAKDKYKGIKTVNETWGTRFWTNGFNNFQEITPPRCGVWDAGNPHIFLDWLRFKSDKLSSYLNWGKDLIKKIDPTHKVGTNGFIGICSRVPDHDLLSNEMEWYGLDIYPKGGGMKPQDVSKFADHWRSYVFRKECEFHITELQGGNNVRWGQPDYVEGKEIRLWTHQMVAHGAQTILYHNWRTPLFGGETGGFGILNVDGTPSKRLEQIKLAIKEVNNIHTELTRHVPEPKVAIAYLRSSEIQTYQEQGPARPISGQWSPIRDDIGLMYSINSLTGAHNIVYNYYNPVGFIFERHLNEGILPFEVVFLPNPYILTEKQAKVLKKYVYDGGILVTEARFGIKDQNGHLYEKPLISTLFDIEYDHTETITKELKITSLEATAEGFRDVVNSPDGVLVSYDDGHPAIIEKKIGKGKLIYSTFSLFTSILLEDNHKLLNFIKENIPVPETRISNSKEVEMVTWNGTKSMILYLINHSNNMDSPIIKIPKKYTVARNIMNGKDHKINNSTLFLEFKPQEVKVISLQ